MQTDMPANASGRRKRRHLQHPPRQSKISKEGKMASTTHTDPVCRMQVTEDIAKATAEHNGRTFYFCSQQCADKFNQDPQKYMQAA
jgi:Cu+-exporting ATPase